MAKAAGAIDTVCARTLKQLVAHEVLVLQSRCGYALNVYKTFIKASGAFSPATLAATLTRPVVGDSSQFIARTIAQMVDSVKATGASVTLVEAYP